MAETQPTISRSITLNMIGDWGQANFHRICSFLTQEFCDRAGPRSRTAIWSMRDGGIEALKLVQDGDAQLCLGTPAMTVADALTGAGMFAGSALPDLRALAVYPQNDRIVLAIDPRFGVSSFAELRAKKPPLRIAASDDDGTNFIGYVTRRMMEAHGIDEDTLTSWGGEYICTRRPEHSLAKMLAGEVDAVIQEAIMLPQWTTIVQDRGAIPLAAEDEVLATLQATFGWQRNSLPAGFWTDLTEPLATLDFSDWVVLVRADLPDDIAYLLTWCLIERRSNVERFYRHLPADRSPMTYPILPAQAARTPIPLHPGAQRFFQDAGVL